ncbi:MAG: 16S rRNA (cytidine(1402)-2'-O)-methyltransferase [Pseudomonadota bacterium]|nr:16S rRNA (cytidine(1402)-2'-O)-methyltransferase [Pseudomonadota bacterium]
MTTPTASLLLQAAAAAAGSQQYPAGALYVVATPIGNLADLTLRAIHVLSLVDAVACEDTRHTSPLMRHLGLDKPLFAVHQHNEQASSGDVIARLARGERVAYVSDAGTPAISDPGAALVASVVASGRLVVAVPGASSAVTAVSVAGDTVGAGFRFIGFLPAKGNERALALKALAAANDTQVLFEAPHRIESLAQGLADTCGLRIVTVCRELTKQFETVVTQPASMLPGWLAGDPNRLRGEFVLVVHAAAPTESTDEAARHDVVLLTLLAELPLKQAVSLAAALTDAPRNALYARALTLKNESTD